MGSLSLTVDWSTCPLQVLQVSEALLQKQRVALLDRNINR